MVRGNAGYVFKTVQTRLPGGALLRLTQGEGQFWPLTGDSMDRFFSRRYRRYLQILADPRDDVQRQIILKLLAEERATLGKTLSKKNKPSQRAA